MSAPPPHAPGAPRGRPAAAAAWGDVYGYAPPSGYGAYVLPASGYYGGFAGAPVAAPAGWDGYFGYGQQYAQQYPSQAAYAVYGSPYGSPFAAAYPAVPQAQGQAGPHAQALAAAALSKAGAQQDASGGVKHAAPPSDLASPPEGPLSPKLDREAASPVASPAEGLDVEIEGGFKGPATNTERGSASAAASGSGAEVAAPGSDATGVAPGKQVSPFGASVFFGGVDYPSYYGADGARGGLKSDAALDAQGGAAGVGASTHEEDQIEWKDYEARFGLDDLLGGLGTGVISADDARTTLSANQLLAGAAPMGPTGSMAAASGVTSGPPPGLGPSVATSAPPFSARTGSLADINVLSAPEKFPAPEVPLASGPPAAELASGPLSANGDAVFQLPSWGTSIGSLGGTIATGDGPFAPDVSASVQNLAEGLEEIGIDSSASTRVSGTGRPRDKDGAITVPASSIAPTAATGTLVAAAEVPEVAEGTGAPDSKKPMSWAAIAKNPPKPAEKVVAPTAAPATRVAATNGAIPAPRTAPSSWASMASRTTAATGPVLTVGPRRTDDAKTKTSEMFAERGINPKVFNTKPSAAKFFVIKSYTEDDVHKSLKYSIWASTEIGNRRLDAAFMENHGVGPIYLFYSVNASGHFCGVAEMLTRVDWNKNSSVWAQDGKWKGVFGVKWIFVKDVPNGALRHLRVASNENKPVTNSRDTQELPPDVGREMLRIFSEYRSKTCIMDDWNWYDERERIHSERAVGETTEEVKDGEEEKANGGI